MKNDEVATIIVGALLDIKAQLDRTELAIKDLKLHLNRFELQTEAQFARIEALLTQQAVQIDPTPLGHQTEKIKKHA